MSSNTVSITTRHKSDAAVRKWNRSTLSDLRQALLKSALAESNAQSFLENALAMMSSDLEVFVTYAEHRNADYECPVGMEPFTVSAQGEPVGTLLADQKALLRKGIPYRSVQELADIVGLSMIALRQNEELAAIENESEEMLLYAPDIIFVTDIEGTVKMANRKAYELLGAKQGAMDGKNVSTILGAGILDGLTRSGRNEGGERVEVEILGQQGRRLTSFNVSLVTQENGEQQILMVGRDITTERQAELALRRTERSTMMAQTIDYLLHEVNNPLGALLSNISTVLRKTNRLTKTSEDTPGRSTESALNRTMQEELTQIHETLSNAKKAGMRINDAMKMLRTANQKRTLSGPKAVDAAFELGLAVSAMEQEHKTVHVMKSLDPLPMMDAPPLHLSEIFGAVLKNAAEALESVSRDARQILVTGGVRNGQLTITIEDNGPGIPSDYLEKIFMPFFTTKPLGHSIGLGLPMAKDMVKRVGGHIEVNTSAKLGGACFRIVFPLK